MEQFGEQFLKAERYLFLSFKNARRCAWKIGTFSAQKWAKSHQNSKKPAKIAGFYSWYLNTTGYMVDDNGLEPLTLRTSSACSTSWANRPSAGCIIQDSFPFVKPFFQNLWKFFFSLPCSPLRSIALAFPGRNGANPAKKRERIEKSPWLSALWMVK